MVVVRRGGERCGFVSEGPSGGRGEGPTVCVGRAEMSLCSLCYQSKERGRAQERRKERFKRTSSPTPLSTFRSCSRPRR